jgi:hypothetical protein
VRLQQQHPLRRPAWCTQLRWVLHCTLCGASHGSLTLHTPPLPPDTPDTPLFCCPCPRATTLALFSKQRPSLTHQTQMFGEGVHPDIERLFETRLAPFLSQKAFNFWSTRLWYFQTGLYYQGGMVRAVCRGARRARVRGLQSTALPSWAPRSSALSRSCCLHCLCVTRCAAARAGQAVLGAAVPGYAVWAADLCAAHGQRTHAAGARAGWCVWWAA